jgi:hypothetical protein
MLFSFIVFSAIVLIYLGTVLLVGSARPRRDVLLGVGLWVLVALLYLIAHNLMNKPMGKVIGVKGGVHGVL